jgi:hypothetical protein
MQSHVQSKCIQCVHQVSNFVDPTSRPPISNVSNHKWKVCCRAYCQEIFSQKAPTPLSRNNPHNDTWLHKNMYTNLQTAGWQQFERNRRRSSKTPVNLQVRVTKSVIPQLWYQCSPSLLVPSSVYVHAQRIRKYLSSTCNHSLLRSEWFIEQPSKQTSTWEDFKANTQTRWQSSIQTHTKRQQNRQQFTKLTAPTLLPATITLNPSKSTTDAKANK